MAIQSALSSKSNIVDAATEIGLQLKKGAPAMVIFFASSHYDPEQVSSSVKNAWGAPLVIGCTTAGELASGKMVKNSIVAMGLGSDIVEDAAVAIVESIKSENNVASAFASFEKHFGVSMSAMNAEKYVGLILIDGLQSAEEKIMMKIGDLTDITFIGGSAGDDLAFKKTFVYADGKTYTNAAVLAVLKLKKGFSIIKTQSFKVLNNSLTATKVDEANRTVLEFNHMPAIEAYAEALGSAPQSAADEFMRHPVGLLTGQGEPFVRSPQQVKDKAMVFYCGIKEGMELSLLESTDIVKDTKAAVDAALSSNGGISGIINFNCILRTLELEEKNQTDAYGKIFQDVPMIGFSTYGEEYIGHINQTATILAFK
jgi:hypothetical protein